MGSSFEGNPPLPKRIKKARIKAGADKYELASHLNIDEEDLTAWEDGEVVPDYEIIKSHATYCKVPLNYYFTEELQEDLDDEDLKLLLKRCKNLIESSIPKDISSDLCLSGYEIEKQALIDHLNKIIME